MKKYIFNSKRYSSGVVAPGIFMICILMYALINNYIYSGINLYTGIAIISAYGVFNTFISISNPKMVVIDNGDIEFYAFRKVHKYKKEEITSMSIRGFHDKKMYLRINNGGLLRGRYWIKSSLFNDSRELYNALSDIERQLHPNALKFRGRVQKSN